MKMRFKEELNRIAVIGNYLPRCCGIATFTTDLCEALAAEMPEGSRVAAVAMDDIAEGYPYPGRVKFQLRDNWLPGYLRAAEYLNITEYKLVILQHEFGIFGGEDGSHILRLIRNLKMPVITTLHTILSRPSEERKCLTLDLANFSEKLVVMSRMGREILMKVYGIPKDKIAFIPHGIPDLGFEDPCFHKDTFGVSGRKVILSFGLLHPGKGCEYMIRALPGVIKRHPEALYIILGATHPHILRTSGDAYRQSLHQLVKRLDMTNHVAFMNRFVDLEELCQYIGAADIYVTPYLSEEQIVSGTLAYTVGAGKAVVSTPYGYAREILADERGRLASFRDPASLEAQVVDLLDNDLERNAMRKRAYQYGRRMTWKEVARGYLDLACEVMESRLKSPKFPRIDVLAPRAVDELPAANLRHLIAMTDDTGMLQHADYSIPDRNHGYCVDDNARALIVASMHYSLYKDEKDLPLFRTYLSFLYHALNRGNGRFRNFMSYDRRWLEESGSEDAHGRALWALGIVVKNKATETIKNTAIRLFLEGLPAAEGFLAPRAWAFSLVGIHAYLQVYGGDSEVRRLRSVLARKLWDVFERHADEEWPWFEDTATYDNGKVVQAMILSGQWLPDPRMHKRGLSALRWLLAKQTSPKGYLSVIGNAGWFKSGGRPSRFDQQPVEAMSLLDACVEAYRSTHDKFWLSEAHRCFNWFLGQNVLGIPLYDFKTGGCLDGLTPDGPNVHQGAESTLAWLISLLTMCGLEAEEIIEDSRLRKTAKDKEKNL